MSFQLVEPRWVQFQQTENLFTFGGKICLFKYALQVISSQRNISTHVNRTNCQLNFDVIPLDVVDYTHIQRKVVPVYPTKQVSLQLDVYLNPLGKIQVLPVYTGLMWFWGVYLRVQTTGACRSVLQSSEDKMLRWEESMCPMSPVHYSPSQHGATDSQVD